jgi:predicted nucleic acid-binding protein
MRITAENALRQLGRHCVTVAAVLIARFRRGETSEHVEARLRARPVREQVFLVGLTLGALLLAALLAAQGGLFGMAAFLLAAILLVG